MADHLVDGPPNPKRQKLDPFQGPSDSSDVLDMFDLENNLPDELMSSSASWGLSDTVTNPKPPAQGPGPGALPNGIENPDNANLRQMQISHMLSQGNKSLVGTTLSLGGQLGNKSPSIQSPPNVSVTKASVDQLNLNNLPSSIANSVGLPPLANNGSTPQVMSSLQGINNSATATMIMTNSNMNTVANMAGGGLVVSGNVNKSLSNNNLLASGQAIHQANLSVSQNLQNGPILNRMTMHLNTRAAGPHVVHSLGTRMQSPNLQMPLGGNVNQGIVGNSTYSYASPNSNPQGVSVATGGSNIPTHVGKLSLTQSRFNGPSGASVAVSNNVNTEGGVGQTHPPAASPVQPQPVAPNTSQTGTQSAIQNQSAPPAPSTDPEKRKLIQQQLVLLLHAHKCQRRESQLNGEVLPCNLPHCKTMKNVLNHMTTCQAGKSCAVAHCSSSRQIISHWKHCVRNDCPVCLPLKQADKNKNSSSVSVTTTTLQNTQSPNPSATDMRRAYDALGIQCPTTGANVVSAGLLSSPIQAKPGLRLPPTGSSNISGLSGNISGVRVLTPSQVQTAANVSLPLGSDSTPITVANTVNPASGNTPQNVNVMFGLTEAGGQGLITQLPGGLQAGQVTANPVQVTKEWHQSVTPDLRNHLVHKLVQAIFPTPDPQAMLDRRMHNLVAYARKVEGDMYEMANSRSEYYHLLAEKIYKIQKELEEKRQKRKEQQLQQQTIQPQNQIGSVVQTSTPSVNMRNTGAPASISQQGLRSNSPALGGNIGGMGVLNPNANRLIFPVPTNTLQSNPQSVAIPGPSPNASSRSAAFVQNMPTTPSTSTNLSTQFPVSCNNSISLPQTSPCANQMGQLNEALKSRLVPSPTSFGIQQSSVAQPNVTSNSTCVPTFTCSSDTVTTALTTVCAPKSVGSSRGPSPSVPSPLQSSPSASSLGKGMPMSERLNLNSSRQSTMSSQMAAITAAHDRDDESPSPPSSSAKGKHEVKLEDTKFKTEELADCNNHNVGGKNIKNEASPEMKKEIKTEPIDEEPIIPSQNSDAALVKTEQRVPNTSSADIKTIPSEMDMESASNLDKKKKCIFKPDELRQKLMPTLEKLYRQDPESHPFRQPVDPQTLGIPDYFDIVKRPMDLSTIKRKLDLGQYSDPWEYVDDVWLMFDNAWLYNRKTSKVYRYCTKLAEVFEQEIDPVMQSMGYCCGRKYTFNPQVLCCYGKQLCTIPRDAKYYSYQNSLKAYGLGSDRYTFCQKCFNEIQGDTVTLGDDPTQAQTAIKKDQFKEMKNDHLEMESFVYCTDCSRKLHQICVLHNENIWPQGFTCDECLKKKGQKRKENKFNAKRLPATNLSVYIENRVNVFLKKKEAGAGEVHIRVVSSSEKVVEVKPGMRGKYVEAGEMCGEFPYRAKALFAFEEIEGVDVCFFGMHVQEYGSECPPPNTRRVYIAYLDSVHFFKPRQYRTAVYHEILLGYMDYVKKLGYTMAHIWACPPSEGDDYIFHCHPVEQKIPKPKRLQDWYKKMLDKGIIERIVFDYKDILKQAMEDNLRSAADLPYFEGDFWPNVLEESIKELDQEEEEKRKRAEAAEAAANAQILSMTEETEQGQDGKKKGQKKAKKSNKSKANQRKNSKKSNMPQTGNDLSAKIFATMEKHKEVFFVIRLHSVQSAASLRPIHDPDPFINCDLMDGRDAFLTLAREKHYEFSSLRRAMYSTMSMLYELHNQGQDKFVYTCNNCKGHVETRYHCTICDDYDLCIQCYEKEGHPHKMEKLGLDLDDGSSPSDTKVNPNDARKLSIQRCIQSLVHACQCRDANCRLTSCLKMKRVVTHTKVCKRKTNGGCPICKQLIALCCYHAKHCQETKCPVPFCSNIKYKLKQQQLQQRLQQAQLLRRRMAVMNTRTAPQGGTLPGANNVPIGTGMQSVLPAGIGPANSLSPGIQNSMNIQSSHQPGIGLKPGTQTPPANVLQVVKQVQEEAARQQAPHTGYGKVNPNVPGQNIPPPPFQRTHMANNQGGGNLLPMEQWQPRYGNNTALRQPSPQLIQAQGSLNQNTIPGTQQPVRPGASAMNSTGNVMQKQALQQLMQMLKSPQSPEQQQQILSILKSNPQLMAACIKQRQQAQMQQTGGVNVSGNQQQQFQHMLAQSTNATQHQARVPLQGSILNQPPQPLNQGPSGQAMVQHQQWIKQQQQIIALQRQQQQQQFQQPNAPPSYQQRLPAIRQPPIAYSNSFSDQQFSPMQNMKPTPPPVPSPQGVMGPPQGSISVQQQQLMQSVRSPPPIRSPQPSPSRPLPSPRNQPIPSPRGPQPSPHDHSTSEMLLGQNHTGPSQDNNEVPPMTPQDQLTKFVEQL